MNDAFSGQHAPNRELLQMIYISFFAVHYSAKNAGKIPLLWERLDGGSRVVWRECNEVRKSIKILVRCTLDQPLPVAYRNLYA